MNTWKVILATMVIFGTGVLTGGLLVRQTDRSRQPRPPQRPPAVRSAPANPGVMRLEFLRRIQRELDLSPQQHQEVDRILKEGQDRTRKLMEPVNPQIRQELERTKQEFMGVLTPAQKARFAELLKQQQRTRDRRDRPPEQKTAPRPE